MKILLGVFRTQTFEYLRNQLDLVTHRHDNSEHCSFDGWVQESDSYDDSNVLSNYWSTIKNACKQAHQIYFDLTHIWFPMPPDMEVVTCCELLWLLENPRLLAKTTFYRNGLEVGMEEVMQMVRKQEKYINA